ncbi:hypothetical protein E1B28_013731 [Marasmius oreades]|uniref:Amino acid permease n=1 Tax=Marasmius oreades TaxID=181124 RepID=A0A9P7RR61_9AGAR|nr:uncharacterized protein E1B28_013731 [Marasmius oreades]KAG7087790.1 hypothetical protein E1B28_013731 [Marasmius oreades]
MPSSYAPAIMNEIDRRADDGLKKLGYQQEMKRSRGLWHTLFMSLAIMAVLFSLTAPIATSLASGGPAVMLWGFVLVSCFSLTVALSLAEICAKYPTSGGAYYWSYRLATPKRRLLLSWINGWATLVGYWTGGLSVTFGIAQLLVAGINIYHPEWVATQWQTYLINLGIILFCASVGIFFNDVLPTLEIFSAYWTLLGVTVLLICLSVKAAAGRHSASFALGFFDASASGWTPGWSFFVGLLPVRSSRIHFNLFANCLSSGW